MVEGGRKGAGHVDDVETELGLEIRTRPQREHHQTGTVVEEGVVDEWSSTSVGAEAAVARTQEPEVLELDAQVADEAEGSAGHPELGWVDEALGNATVRCGESELVLAVQDWQRLVPDLSAEADDGQARGEASRDTPWLGAPISI